MFSRDLADFEKVVGLARREAAGGAENAEDGGGIQRVESGLQQIVICFQRWYNKFPIFIFCKIFGILKFVLKIIFNIFLFVLEFAFIFFVFCFLVVDDYWSVACAVNRLDTAFLIDSQHHHILCLWPPPSQTHKAVTQTHSRTKRHQNQLLSFFNKIHSHHFQSLFHQNVRDFLQQAASHRFRLDRQHVARSSNTMQESEVPPINHLRNNSGFSLAHPHLLYIIVGVQ